MRYGSQAKLPHPRKFLSEHFFQKSVASQLMFGAHQWLSQVRCVAVKIFEHLYVDMPSSGPESTEVKLEMVGYFLDS